MQEITHTPGQWKAVTDSGAVTVEIFSGEKRICTLDLLPEQFANARLIAEAPELQKRIGNLEAILGKYRLAVDTLLTAASELEAAMDGSTDQYPEEIGELRKALRLADSLCGQRSAE